jgi:HPt (histidine-containing phosphotransfer) domain-containing protein
MPPEANVEEGAGGGRPVALVDRTLEPLIDRYMGGRRDDIEAIRRGLDGADLEDVRIRGHSMKGSGGGYGFDEITEIGAGLEAAAVASDVAAIEGLVDRLQRYVDSVEIRFVDRG